MKKMVVGVLLLVMVLIFRIPFSWGSGLSKKSTTTLISENFQRYAQINPWKPAKGWSGENAGGSWAITVIGNNHFLQYFGPGNSGSNNSENRLLNGKDNWTDMTVTVRLKLSGDSYAGISRVKTNGDIYDIFITGNCNVALLRRAEPVDTTLATAGFLIKPDTFYKIKVVFTGSRIMIFMNNSATAIINIDAGVAEQGHKPGGKVGLYARSQTNKDSASFDDLLVTIP